MMFVIRLLAASALLSLIATFASCAWAAASLTSRLAAEPAREPAPERSGLVLLRDDLGFEPQAAGLGRGGPPADVRPVLGPRCMEIEAHR